MDYKGYDLSNGHGIAVSTKEVCSSLIYSKYTLNFQNHLNLCEIVTVPLKRLKDLKICKTLLLGLSKIVQQ